MPVVFRFTRSFASKLPRSVTRLSSAVRKEPDILTRQRMIAEIFLLPACIDG